MGLIVSHIGDTPVDRNVAKLEIKTHDDNPDNWEIEIKFQDAPYDAQGNRLYPPRPDTEIVLYRYGAVKNEPLPNGGTMADLFSPIRALCYALRDKKIADDAATANAEHLA